MDGIAFQSTEDKTQIPQPTKKGIRWKLLFLNFTFMVIGAIGSPLLSRLYFVHGGNRKWLQSWLQTAGFPIYLIPLSVLYIRSPNRRPPAEFLAEPKLLVASAGLGQIFGLGCYLYALGLSFLPVSTSSLLLATQLAFNALFALIIVRQRFTAYSINAILLMILGSIILGIRKSGDRPPNVSNGQYLLGFLVTLGASALLGLLLPCTELAYTKGSSKAITYQVVLQFQLGVAFFATVFSTVGMLINKDFKAIPREAREYGLGEAKYYVVLVTCATTNQLLFMGTLGVIFCTSSLTAGVVGAALLPFIEVAGVVAFKENFTAEKGMALALCLWGFASYFYGDYKKNKNQKKETTQSENNRALL